MSGPIRGLHDVEGKLFAVSGNKLYQISNSGVAIPLGTIPGTGRVSMAHNQVAGGNQLIVVNGSSGYVWNTVTQTFQKVVDSSYPGASIAEFIDGYLVQLEPFGRFILHSELADALAYNALDRFEAETAPDMTNGLAILHQEVWALGERTIDVFENTGQATGTFRNKGVSIAKGCMARWSTAVIDNGLAWLGHDGAVYHARGYDPTRISTRAIEVALSECSETDRRNAFAFVWEDRGHAVYYLTIPNGPTFGYDFFTGLWHRRASWHPVKDISGRWRLNDLVRSNGQWIGGDYQSGRLYVLDWDYMLDGCDPLIRERTSAVAHNNGARFTVDQVEVFFDTGSKVSECVTFPYQPVGPNIGGAAPDGALGLAYDGYTYTSTSGDAPIVSSVIVSGSLPPGISYDGATHTLSATTPTQIGNFTFTIRDTDANGLSVELTDTIAIVAVSFATTVGSDGVLIVSPTGESWGGSIDSGLGADIYLLKAFGGRVFCLGLSAGRVSADYGVTWVDVVYDGDFDDLEPTSMTYADGVWVITFKASKQIGRSTDGVTFVPIEISANTQNAYTSIARGDIFLVGASHGRLFRSEDKGESWSLQTLSAFSTSSIDLLHLQGDAFIAHLYISSPGPTRHIFINENEGFAGSWGERDAPEVSAFGVRMMISGDNRLIYVGLDTNYKSFVSTDLAESFISGGDLSASISGVPQNNNITFNGRYFIVGVNGNIDITTDASEWAVAHNAGPNVWLVASLGELLA